MVTFAILSLVPLLTLFIYVNHEYKEKLKFEVAQSELLRLEGITNNINLNFEKINFTLGIISNDRAIQELVQISSPHNTGKNSKIKSLWSSQLKELFAQMAISYKEFNQIRILNKSGFEVLQVNQEKGLIFSIKKKYLQSVKDRNYFHEIINLKNDEIYYSPIEFNQELGKVDQDRSLIIRVGKKVYSKSTGDFIGVVIIDFDIKKMLKPLVMMNQSAKKMGRRLIVIDDIGNYLVHSNRENELGLFINKESEIDLNKDTKFTDLISGKRHMSGYNIQEGEFRVWHFVNLQSKGKKKFWVVLSLVDQDQVFSTILKTKKIFTYILILFCFIIIFISTVFSRIITSPIAILSKIADKISNDDYDVDFGDIKGFYEMNILANSFISMIKNLKIANSKISSVFETAVDGIAIISEDGVVQTANESFFRTFGYAKDEIIGKNIKKIMPRPFQDEHDQYLLNYKKTGVKKIIGIGREVKGKTKDGRSLDLYLSVSQFQLEEGVFYSGILKDISIEKKQARDIELRSIELEKINRDLEISNEQLEQFAYIASHDMLTPLRHITAYTQKINDKFRTYSDEASDKWFRYVDEGTLRMRKMIIDLLAFSKVGKGSLVIEVVNLNGIFTKISTQLEEDFKKNNTILKKCELPTVIGCEGLLFQLFQNLITNAVKFRKKDGSVNIIDVTMKEYADSVIVEISDNGIGIKKELRKRAFDIFKQFNSKSEYQGTGIGLSVCKKIATLHGGVITIGGEFGVGSIFTVRILKDATDRIRTYSGGE